eukprot:8774066-Pyramimonas_sp.AAC.1
MKLSKAMGLILHQCQGIHIGGPLRGAILHADLSKLEWLFDKSHPRNRRRMARGRYVDDLFLAPPRARRRECLRLHVDCVYGHVVKLKVEDECRVGKNTVALKFLEAELH